MADLPQEICTEAAPFTYCGVDVQTADNQKRRSKLKYYGAAFTYFSTCAVHIQATNSLDFDSFIKAFHRFMAIR